jgi:hypothetical protein
VDLDVFDRAERLAADRKSSRAGIKQDRIGDPQRSGLKQMRVEENAVEMTWGIEIFS